MSKLTLPIADAKVVDFAFGQFVIADTADSTADKARTTLESAKSRSNLARHAAYAALGREHDRLVMGGSKSPAAWAIVSDAILAKATKKSDRFRAGLTAKTIEQYASSATWLVSAGFVTAEGKLGEGQTVVMSSGDAKGLKAKSAKLTKAAKKAKLSVPAYVESQRSKGVSAYKLAQSFAPAPTPRTPTAGDSLNIDTPSEQPSTVQEAIGMLTTCAARMADLVGIMLQGTFSADEKKTALQNARVVRQHAASVIGKLDPPKPKAQPSTQAADQGESAA